MCLGDQVVGDNMTEAQKFIFKFPRRRMCVDDVNFEKIFGVANQEEPLMSYVASVLQVCRLGTHLSVKTLETVYSDVCGPFEVNSSSGNRKTNNDEQQPGSEIHNERRPQKMRQAPLRLSDYEVFLDLQVPAEETIKLVVFVASYLCCSTHHMDVKFAFLNGPLEEKIFKCKSCSPTLVDTENTLDKSEGDQIVDNTLYWQMKSFMHSCFVVLSSSLWPKTLLERLKITTEESMLLMVDIKPSINLTKNPAVHAYYIDGWKVFSELSYF
ncbi:hypothetical protein PHAVU_003G244500 [Phaseolus vulgaris]|uniref:Reverse transcriptase Ty1/copia-type domain-containing protein n=1 Tax=Phaseolus vulgaris TaxID=3885 RepID=V7CG78_PHAVU|nr:hypothetical protein PHAVU_003G244500g [Phaseolus vulgaris]ESW27926.1 hypothetical protein PHAVU_003G244500g [Phaseolus vulgaris]